MIDAHAMTRLQTHSSVSARLARLDDGALAALVETASPLHSGIGGSSRRLTIDGASVFVKKVPLTDLERIPRNVHSTANLFDLPMFCQYGLGGCPGFGAWRELAANLTATDWVLRGECENFPVLYHWRVMPASKPAPMNAEELAALERDVSFWENSDAVRDRIKAVHDASAHLVLFSEYVPQNLLEWLTARFEMGADAAEEAVAFVKRTLWSTNAFMNAHGLTHFDVHFENIMTDGRLLYFGDFGLALSSEFELTDAERAFLARHGSYDHGRAAVGFVHAISASFFGKDGWKEGLNKYLKTGNPLVPPAVAAALERWAPVALAFLEFSRGLRNEGKQIAYPAERMEGMLAKIEI